MERIIIIVIMDQVSGRDTEREFRDNDLPQTVINNIRCALKVLHNGGLVFGDLRHPNIMVTKSPADRYGDNEWHGQLIDFNWSGKKGEATYPTMLNDKILKIKWAPGVEAAAVILSQHDRDMLKQACGDW